MFRNHFSVLGNAGAEPTLHRTLTGGVVATVNVATNYRHKGTDGRWIESTEWHRITAFDRLAKELQESVKKGTRVAADGYMRTRKFVDANQHERYVHELVATQLLFGHGADAPPQAEREPERAAAPGDNDGGEYDVRVI
ncbi:MAG TPA: single-stranded DNA-binding protein [Candidatus Acidoferrales bacterium]|nr:single-stranded DNA-binding protein [Candidatus Acidoferrales bacterium]